MEDGWKINPGRFLSSVPALKKTQVEPIVPICCAKFDNIGDNNHNNPPTDNGRLSVVHLELIKFPKTNWPTTSSSPFRRGWHNFLFARSPKLFTLLVKLLGLPVQRSVIVSTLVGKPVPPVASLDFVVRIICRGKELDVAERLKSFNLPIVSGHKRECKCYSSTYPLYNVVAKQDVGWLVQNFVDFCEIFNRLPLQMEGQWISLENCALYLRENAFVLDDSTRAKVSFHQ